MGQTKIEWCDKSWNVITGCSPVSDGCTHCYAKRMAKRLRGRYGYPKDDPFKVTFHPDRLDEPLRWRKPSRIFVCSMADPFHKDVKEEWFIPIMHKIRLEARQHTYLFLTKRPQNIENYLANWFLPKIHNLFLGVSVEDQRTADERIPILLQIPAAKKFISVEPMLGPVKFLYKWLSDARPLSKMLDLGSPMQTLNGGIDWIICGGETGPGARPLHPDWARDLLGQCQAAGVPLFIKTFPVDGKPSNRIDDWPEDVRIRRYPDAI